MREKRFLRQQTSFLFLLAHCIVFPETAFLADGGKATVTRIRGLDSIRFICAIWVMLGHIGLPPIFGNSQHGLLHIVNGVYNGIVNGPAAVIVFFVISGFCIHYPYRNGKQPHLPSYYTRRLLRIGLPLIVAVPLSYLVNVPLNFKDVGIMWSLVAEIVYYLIYPALLVLYRRYNWQKLIIPAFIIAFGIAATKPDAGNYPSFGTGLNWLLGLPVWLLGCLLAQKSDALPQTISTSKIWLWRGAIVAASCLATILRWHIPHVSVGFPWTLSLFSPLVFLWLGQEIVYCRTHPPLKWLEWAGAWSYSLYLVHVICPAAFDRYILMNRFPALAQSFMNITAALLGAYLFFVVVERPSHLFSVWASAKFKKPSPSSSPVTVAAKQT